MPPWYANGLQRGVGAALGKRHAFLGAPSALGPSRCPRALVSWRRRDGALLGPSRAFAVGGGTRSLWGSKDALCGGGGAQRKAAGMGAGNGNGNGNGDDSGGGCAAEAVTEAVGSALHGGDSGPSSSAPSRGPPPQRHIRQYFIPGLDEMERQGATAAKAKGPLVGSSEERVRGNGGKAVAAVGTEPQPSDPRAPLPTAVGSQGPVEPLATARAPAAASPADAVSTAEGDQQQQRPASGCQAGAGAPQEGGPPSLENRPLANSAVGKSLPFPGALVRDTAERNQRIKQILMDSLGADFAKAGTHNDGVRTSFSVVSYQTVKQRTGLKGIPAKLLVSCLTSPDKSIDWIDISAHPTATLAEYKEAIREVLIGLNMHSAMIDDSMESMLLPQVTLTKESQSLLMRYAIDVQDNERMDSFQDLTNRFTLFITANRVVTVHRTQCTYVEELKKNWYSTLEEEEGGGRVTRCLLFYFVQETVKTFTCAISKCIVEFDRYEAGLFAATRARASLAREIYHIKRRAAVYARTLTLTKDAYTHMSASLNIYSSNVSHQEVLHDLAHMESLAEELNANADSVLQLLFQLSSFQVNELMRVLTLFNAFFIPIAFIASVYGMNFDNLPFLHSAYGEVYCGLLMACVAASIYFWFKAKHFV